MSLLRESCLYRLWLAFWASYLDSSLSRLIRRVENWCGRQVETSPFAGRASWPGAGQTVFSAACLM